MEFPKAFNPQFSLIPSFQRKLPPHPKIATNRISGEEAGKAWYENSGVLCDSDLSLSSVEALLFTLDTSLNKTVTAKPDEDESL